MHLGRNFQAQGVEPDEAGGVHPLQSYYGGRVVLVVGLGRVGFHRGVHGHQFTLFSGLWQPAFLPVQPENQSAASAVRAVVAADRECPSCAAALQ